MHRLALAALAALSLLPACTSREAVPVSEVSADRCTNGADDDLDGLADCADPGCASSCAGADGGGDPLDGGRPPADTGPRPDVITPTCTAPIDLVFVLDVSTSMNDEAAALRDGIESIWNAAHALTSDTQFGLVVFVDDALADGGCAPYTSLTELRARFDHWRSFCASNLSPVSEIPNSDCPENSLDALHLAARQCSWRPGATRILIHVTDDTFVERPEVLSGSFLGGGVEVQHTYAEVASELVTRELRVGAFAAPGAGEECGAGASSNVGQGFHEPFRGMASLPEQTGGRAWSIRDVRAGTLDMATAINELIEEEHCSPF